MTFMSETCHHMFEQIIVSNYKWYIILYILYIFKTYVLLCTIYSKKMFGHALIRSSIKDLKSFFWGIFWGK